MKNFAACLFGLAILSVSAFLVPTVSAQEEDETVAVSGFQRDFQPVWIRDLACHLSKKTGKLVCNAEIQNVSGTSITAIGFRWEQGIFGVPSDHGSFQIRRSSQGYSDWKSTQDSKAKGRLEKRDKVSIEEETEPIQNLQGVHFHILFVELEDGTVPGGIDARFQFLYDKMAEARRQDRDSSKKPARGFINSN